MQKYIFYLQKCPSNFFSYNCLQFTTTVYSKLTNIKLDFILHFDIFRKLLWKFMKILIYNRYYVVKNCVLIMLLTSFYLPISKILNSSRILLNTGGKFDSSLRRSNLKFKRKFNHLPSKATQNIQKTNKQTALYL